MAKYRNVAPNFKYVIDKDEKVVVAIVINAENYIRDQMSKYVKGDIAWDICYEAMDKLNSKTFRGIARCSDEDTFDETTGMRIAESKALLKLHAGIADCVYQAAVDGVTSVMFLWDKQNEKMEHEQNHLDELIAKTYL